jgi:pectinesterase
MIRAGLYAALTALALTVCAKAQKKTVTVALDGSGDYRDVQSAVNAAPATGGLIVRIKPGVYQQVLSITANGVELHGLGTSPKEVVLTFGNSHAMAGGTGKSASTTISGDDFLAENLTFANSYSRDHPEVTADAQAVALLVTGDKELFRHVRMIGAQDTLYANSKTCHAEGDVASGKPCEASRQLYQDCYIEGHVDFIFGDAKAVFDHCEIHAIPHSVVTITAQSRVYRAEDAGYLFKDCTVTGDPEARNILLGRPWRPYSTVTFLDTDFKARLNPAGWAEWDGKLKTSTYKEFGSTGLAGPISDRIGETTITAAQAKQITVKSWLRGWDGSR